MRVLLTTLNAKYVHTSLGLWYIYHYCRPAYPELAFSEYNINQDLSWILGEIFLKDAAVVAFSCNIWNREQTLTLSQRLKAVAPQTLIVLGGPEVWNEPVEIMKRHPAIDFIVIGEGELTFDAWLAQLKQANPDWTTVSGLIYRNGAEVVINPPRPQIDDLSCLPFPYPEDLNALQKKLVYYETTRGCPYQCQYCLSANEQGVRYFSLERVKRELLRFCEAGIAQVKLVDRSFNCNPKWAKELWQFLIDHAGGGTTNYHFEVIGDLLDEESLMILEQAPPGLFQFEIGVQSTNPETLSAIRRRMNFERLSVQVAQLVRKTSVFVHLDLIAGLPFEDYASFARSFDATLALKPHRLQLGFLKLLQGSGLRSQAKTYEYCFTTETPYEVLANRWLSYPELLKLKTIEDLLDRYYNSGRFQRTLEFLFARIASPFAWLARLSDWWKSCGLDQLAHQNKELYAFLLDFLAGGDECSQNELEAVRNLLKFDLLTQERMVELPVWAGENDPELRSFGHQFWKDAVHRETYFGKNPILETRELQRRTLFARFTVDPLAVEWAAGRIPVFQPVVILFIYQRDGVKTYKIAQD